MGSNIINVVALFKKSHGRPGDDYFRAIRNKIADLLARWHENPGNAALADKAYKLLDRMSDIRKDDTSGHTYDRAHTNSVVIPSRMRRTHYAAYLAGKLSTSDDIGDHFKSWMHNAAANGAVSLSETLDDFINENRPTFPNTGVELLQIFRNGAIEDAMRFISIAESFDRISLPSVLTQYNKAKLNILSADPDLRHIGITQLRNLQPPLRGCHPAEISWHEDNYSSFLKRDDRIKKIIRTHDADSLAIIEHTLRINAEQACQIKNEIQEEKGDLWGQHTEMNRKVVATLAVGTLVTGLAVQDKDTLLAIAEFVRMSVDALSVVAPSTEAASLGDGGLAQPSLMASEAVRATFGDGGLA